MITVSHGIVISVSVSLSPMRYTVCRRASESDENKFVSYPWEHCFEERDSALIQNILNAMAMQLQCERLCDRSPQLTTTHSSHTALSSQPVLTSAQLRLWLRVWVHCTLCSSTSGPLIGCPTVYYFLWTNFAFEALSPTLSPVLSLSLSSLSHALWLCFTLFLLIYSTQPIMRSFAGKGNCVPIAPLSTLTLFRPMNGFIPLFTKYQIK